MAKLVEILARELKEWPYQTAYMAQDESAKVAGFIHHEDLIYHGCGHGWYGRPAACSAYIRTHHFKCELAYDHATAIVTRAEWQAAVDALKQKDIASITAAMIDAGWIDPKPPVSPSLHVQVLGRGNRIPQWDGVGLPPVGLEVEWLECNQAGWQTVTVLAYHKNDAWIMVGKKEPTTVFNPANFRPIRTPEQIAAEERAAAVSSIMADAGITDSAFADDPEALAWAESLYDAGYRKQEQK